MLKKFINSIKFIKLNDIVCIFRFLLMIIPSLVYRLLLKIKKKKMWLIIEDGYEARDNGYCLFKYIMDNHPNDNVYYVIDFNSKDYEKLKRYKNIINYGSIKHWLYYMSANLNISTHKHGNPCPPVFYVAHVYMNLYNNRIFLQHGITMNDAEFIKYKNSKFKIIICAAKAEYEFIKNNFGYKKQQVKLLGFSRFDNLYNVGINKKQIVIMPTWRSNISKSNIDFKTTPYYKNYNSLINNKKLINYIEKNNITIYFYLHRNMQKYVEYFNTISKNIVIVKKNNIDIQMLIQKSILMITDYSSVSLDFAYMNKPLIYYQFDQKDFFESQYKPGYFSYKENGFGDVILDENILIDKIINYDKINYKIENKYQKRVNEFFKLRDKNNNKRIYQFLKKM